MEDAVPKRVHALSFASLAHKSLIKDVSFAYTEGMKMPPQVQDAVQAQKGFTGLHVCILVGIDRERPIFSWCFNLQKCPPIADKL